MLVRVARKHLKIDALYYIQYFLTHVLTTLTKRELAFIVLSWHLLSYPGSFIEDMMHLQLNFYS